MKVIVEQGDILDALLAIVKDGDTGAATEILRKMVKESEPMPPARTLETASPGAPPIVSQEASRGDLTPPKPAINPSSARLEELRDMHGPVYRVTPKVPVTVGQTIKNSEGREIEMLELDDRGNENGEVAVGVWFAKMIA